MSIPKSGKTTKTRKKKADDTLASCPMNGQGWCPYPFSVAQLKRRLKAKAQAEAEARSAELENKASENKAETKAKTKSKRRKAS
ncbi:MAG: hypothetical protein J0M35_06845 [Candidatus Obscuribacter phosphatis]|uniref:Uncharacterized protein n=1 Tax=Candidatus Obscuribacter phosphatis TaxID=1906157 RepID=A0A8J7P7F3_9BACT|nr:hypothetical protein [Candidatus Obscuribacter phosphatis]